MNVTSIRRSPAARFADLTGLAAAVVLLGAISLYLVIGDLQFDGLRSHAMSEGLLDQI